MTLIFNEVDGQYNEFRQLNILTTTPFKIFIILFIEKKYFKLYSVSLHNKINITYYKRLLLNMLDYAIISITISYSVKFYK